MNRLPLLLFVALVLGAGQAQAQAQTGWLDRFNRAMGSANAALAEGVSDLAAAIPWRNPLPPEWAGYGGNLLANTLHEPVTALSYAAMLDGDRAMLSLRRFGINLMLGYGGLVDRATEQGVVVARADPGLALCAWGVPAGPYVVLPLLGGRSLRDGLAEIALSGGVILPAIAPLLTSVVPGSGALLSLPGAEEAATLLIARQIDTGAGNPVETAAAAIDFDLLQAAYLARREARCAQLAAR